MDYNPEERGIPSDLVLERNAPAMRVEITIQESEGSEEMLYWRHYYITMQEIEHVLGKITGHDFESFRLEARQE